MTEHEAPPTRRWSATAPMRRVLTRFRSGGRTGTRVSVRTVLQMEAVECGAASLAMILSHFGSYIALEELRASCGVSRDGSKASNLLKAARSYGLIAKGYKKEPEQLKAMPMPCIVHWHLNHFVVVEGFDAKFVYINDPARGPTIKSYAEFDSSFTGVVLAFTPGPDFKRVGHPPSLVRSLAPRLAGSQAGLLFVVLAGLALVLPGILASSFSRVYVDNVLVKGFRDLAPPLYAIMLGTVIIQGSLFWLQRRYLLRLETKLALKTSGEFLWHVLRLPYAFFQQRYAGDLATRIGLNDRIARLLSSELATALLDMMLVIFYAAMMLEYDVVLAGIGLTTAFVNMGVLRYTAKRRRELNQRMVSEQSTFTGVSMGGVQIIETLKATGSESEFFERWAGYLTRQLNTVEDIAVASRLLNAVPTLLLSINAALLLGIGGLRIIDGRLSVGMLLAFQALMLAFLAPVNRIVTLGSTLEEVNSGLVRLDDVLRATLDDSVVLSEPDAALTSGTNGSARLSGEIELRNVTFGYSPLEPPLVSNFSMRLTPGSRVALVGKSGSGKSTVSRLVTGLFRPWEGEILFDGKARSEYPREMLTNSIAVVDQDIFLFEGTVRDNLALWDPAVQERDILRAGHDACIHEDISTRVGGYASRVDERGANFSGGQRQRIEIARALVSNPPIVVLDEATSALDPATEKTIDDNLRRRGCTCLIVAHRLSTIRDCDEIIVMDRGVTVQRGKHDDLRSVPGLYRDLVAAE